MEGEKASSQSRREVGMLKRMRRSLTYPRLSASKSSVNAFQAHSMAESRIDTVVVQMKRRARYYHCIPLPPGCIPTEMITEGSQQQALHPTSSLAQCEMGQIPVQPDGSKFKGENNQERETLEQGMLLPQSFKTGNAICKSKFCIIIGLIQIFRISFV